MTKQTPKLGHRVRPEDRERIRCPGPRDADCGALADYCEYAPFDVCGVKGISFWYYCAAHTRSEVRAAC